MPSWRAKASAIRGEPTSSMIRVPDRGAARWLPVSRHAIPALFRFESHAASTEHRWDRAALASCRRFVFIGKASFSFALSWAWFHSSAAAILLVIISIGCAVLFSKINLFRANHRNQTIQGRIGTLTPVGGRQTIVLAITARSWKSASAARWTGELRGAKRHTSFAKGHWKNTCIAVSSSLQQGHCVSVLIPLRCSSFPKGKAPWAIDHKNRMSFGAVFTDQMSLIQLNSRGRERLGGMSWEVAIPSDWFLEL